MHTRTVFLTLFTLLVGTSVLTPGVALAERDGDRERQPQSRSEHRENQHAHERKEPQRAEPKRVEQQRPHVATKAPQRAEQRQPRRIERNSQQSVERKENRQHNSAIARQQAHDGRAEAKPEHRRQIETRRSFHIEQPRKPVYNRAYHHVPRQRHYRGVRVYRSYGYLYPGFGFYYSDNDAFRWLAFTALTLAIFDQLDEKQQRMHEQAQIRATTAYAGDTIYWQGYRSSGSITVTDIWQDRRGRECRELEQRVTAHGRTETSFGTVCENRNGAWEVARLD